MPVPWPGQILKDTYRIDREIGEGGTGLVFTGFHLRLKVPIAVKILKQSAGGLAFARFRKEAEITARLRHPDIVQILDYDVTPDGHAYIVTEWLEGETLGAYMKRQGPLPAEVVVALLGPVCEAVAAAHAEGVVHRDLKPANLFLSKPPGGAEGFMVKVLDFGIAKLTDVDPVRTEQGQTVGTPRYMSPEQIKVESVDHVGPASDQFSLGSIAYEMVAGRPAFPGSAQVAMLAVLDCRPEPMPPSVPAPFQAAVRRAMSKDPAARFASVSDFLAALRTSVEATQEPPLAAPMGSTRAALLLSAGAAFLLVLLLVLTQHPPDPTLPVQIVTPDGGQVASVLIDRTARSAGVIDLATAETIDLSTAAQQPEQPALVRVKLAVPSGAQLYVNGSPVHGGQISLPEGLPAQLRLVAEPEQRRKCCPARDLRYTPQAGKRPPSLEMTCRDKCLW